MNDHKNFSLVRLLAWLADDRQEAGERYVRFQQELIEYVGRGGGHTAAADLADEVFNRVDKRLAVFLLNEHFNSTEIGDFPNLCRNLLEGGAKSSPSPGRRIWELLSPDDRAHVSRIVREGTFKRVERSRVSEALNKILSRRDFYHAEDFNLSAIRTELGETSKIENIEAALTRGLPQLSQNEIEKFNRCLLEAVYPLTIKTNLADTPDAEKLARCKHYAGIVLLEYQKEPQNFKTQIEKPDETNSGGANPGDTTSIDPVEKNHRNRKEGRKAAMVRLSKRL